MTSASTRSPRQEITVCSKVITRPVHSAVTIQQAARVRHCQSRDEVMASMAGPSRTTAITSTITPISPATPPFGEFVSTWSSAAATHAAPTATSPMAAPASRATPFRTPVTAPPLPRASPLFPARPASGHASAPALTRSGRGRRRGHFPYDVVRKFGGSGQTVKERSVGRIG